MLIFSIETSCDETAAAIVEDGILEISSSVASSSELHEKTGGIVPEVAARKQVEYITPIINQTIEQAAVSRGISKDELVSQIDAVAVTSGPGLIGSLVVGVEAAKALAFSWDVPLIPVNHLVGHVYANFIQNQDTGIDYSQIKFPAVCLVVSGGHTDLVLMRGHGKLEYLGGTLDDAAGEAFDKTARLLGLSRYKLGGPMISQAAAECKVNALAGRLPRPMMDSGDFDFSFSGLKTAVKYLFEREHPPVEQVACEFETAVVDVLVDKTIKAAQKHKAQSILLGGGVVANKQLRSRINNQAANLNIPVYFPSIKLCGDSAVYIASAAFFTHVDTFNPSEFDKVQADPSLGILDLPTTYPQE